MPQFQSTRRVNHAADDMLELVADVEHYPDFLPYCLDCSVLRRKQSEDGREVLIVNMTVGYGPLRESFVSRVKIDREKRRVVVANVDGPFKALENRWTFTPQGESACDVEFYIAYAFRSRAFEMLAGAIFDKLFRAMSDAFFERANVKAREASVSRT